MRKWYLIPRSGWDLLKVLLHGPGAFDYRWQLTKALAKLKWYLHFREQDQTVEICLGDRCIRVFNEPSTQFILKEIWIEEVYRPQIPIDMKRLLDLGANVGLTSLFWRVQYGNADRHIALEPDGDIYSLLRKNLPGLDIRQEAAGTEPGFARRVETENAERVNARYRLSGESETVKMVSIKELLSEQFDLIKVDVEGAEWEMLNSVISDPDLLKRARYWMVEFHSGEEHREKLEDILKVFTLSGYKNLQKGDVMHFYHA